MIDVMGGTSAILNSDHLSLITTPGIDLTIAPGAGVFSTPLPGPNYGWHTCIRNVGPGGVVLSGSSGAQINGASSIELDEGQALNLYSVGPSNYAAVKIGGGGAGGAGRLEYDSATLLRYAPFNGGHIMLNGALRPLLAGGIAGLTNAGLVANTTYLVSVTDVGGILTADFRTGATHGPSQTAGNEGTEIIYVGGTPHDELSLLGMCHTNASGQFVDASNTRWVLSWFNRRKRAGQGLFTANRSTTSASWVELNQEIRVNFLTWAEDVATCHLVGALNGAAICTTGTNIWVDGSPLEAYTNTTIVSAGYAMPIGASGVFGIAGASEGAHWATMMGMVNNGTAVNWVGSNTPGARSALMVEIFG